jgi:hypothetical protein
VRVLRQHLDCGVAWVLVQNGSLVIRRLGIKNFQSHGRTVIPLGSFTVVTGATGAGKSAAIRAAELLAGNARGVSYISTGQPSCTVAAESDEGWSSVAITRTARGGGSYRLSVPPAPPASYTKLGGKVPAPVAAALRMSPLNVAGQHDPPYLLRVPPAELARTLGELTNVSLVFAAAADANRVRKGHDRDLAGARSRRDALRAQAQEFAGLRARRDACTEAEAALERLQQASAALERLRALAARQEVAQAAAEAARREAQFAAPPSLARLEELSARLASLRQRASAVRDAAGEAGKCAGLAQAAAADVAAAQERLRIALKAAGNCPVCGSIVS